MIKAVNLNKVYYQGKSKIEAIGDVCLEIQRGESVLIAGSSGAGKSTLLHLLGGLDRPTQGKILFNGEDFYGLSDSLRSKIRNEKIGFVFQFYHLLPEFTLLENIMLPALMRRNKIFSGKNDVKKRASGLLGMVGLASRASHKPAELSGGESQRAAIARALINSPEVLLCDEPTGNLDSKIGNEIINCLLELRNRQGMALVIVTHDEDMRDSFDKKFRMQDGVLVKLISDGRWTMDDGRNVKTNSEKTNHPSSVVS